jgi:DNA-binding LacI/PurR family transcriptional regulator
VASAAGAPAETEANARAGSNGRGGSNGTARPGAGADPVTATTSAAAAAAPAETAGSVPGASGASAETARTRAQTAQTRAETAGPSPEAAGTAPRSTNSRAARSGTRAGTTSGRAGTTGTRSGTTGGRAAGAANVVTGAQIRNVARPPVMADVARLAGVSHQTVSRVLNDHPNVRPNTRDRVLAAIRELAYRPNAAARTLVTRRTHTLGVISFDTTLYGPASMMYGIERAAHDSYFVSIASLPALDRRSMLDAVERFLGQGVEGIIVIAPQTSAVTALSYVQADVPLVAVGCGTRATLTSVAIDNAAGAASATSYLLDLGHRTVYHVAGPGSWLDAQERVDGWRQALRDAGAPEPPVLTGDWSASSGYDLGHRLAALPDATAIFCGNDTMALGVMRALAERGRDVPGEISVVGFDDVPEAGFYLPPLTTVRQDFGEVGRRALGALIDRMSGDGGPGPRLRIAPELIVRRSAGRATASRVRP